MTVTISRLYDSHATFGWQEKHGVQWHYIVPGKPAQNGFIESSTVAYGTNV